MVQKIALEEHFLWLLVGMKLQPDGSLLDPVRHRLAPVRDKHAIENEAHPVPLGQDLDVIPVVLLADFLRLFRVLMD